MNKLNPTNFYLKKYKNINFIKINCNPQVGKITIKLLYLYEHQYCVYTSVFMAYKHQYLRHSMIFFKITRNILIGLSRQHL